MIFGSSTYELKIVLSGAVTANELPITGSYTDITDSTGAITGLYPFENTTNGTTAISLFGTSASGVTRKLQGLSVHNADTASATVRLYCTGPGGDKTILKVILGVGYQLTIMDDGSWSVKDQNGVESQAASAAPSDADYIVKTAHAGLSAERVLTDTNVIDWDWSSPAAAKGRIGGSATLYGAFDALSYPQSIASASTVNLQGSAVGVSVRITGTTTITSFGTGADGIFRMLSFAGSLTLTHNATSLILPTGANITTTAGDTAIFQSLGSGNWRCISYTPVTANLPVTVVKIQVFTSSGTYTPDANMVYCISECVGGGGAGGGSTGHASYTTSGGGGGSGAYSRKISTRAAIGASQSVTIGAGGTGVNNGSGNAGGDTSLGSILVAKGGSGGTLGSSGAFGIGGLGGLASGGTGDIKTNGNSGNGGFYSTVNGVYVPSGLGGVSHFGGGSAAAYTSGGSSTNGNAGTEYGAGGSGSMSVFVASNKTGGDGFKGCLIITEFCTR